MADGGNVIFKFLGDDKQLKSTMGSLGSIGKTALKGLAVGTGAAVAGFTAMVKSSVEARGEFEQLEGGVKKLFGKDSQKVMNNASKAFKEVGISANEYMEQVTSFSASLIQSLDGDTEQAVDVAHRAMKDMADNANTFGTSIESIQHAYQGFAKGNFTMLDNLKLGYGGTKTEMERLISEASKMKDVQKELNITVDEGDLSFANIANAISVVQKNMEIMGTTENEAMNTLTGSISALKASWDNFLAGTGDLSQVVDSGVIAFENILRIVKEAMPQIMTSIKDNLPQILELGGDILKTLANGLMENLPDLFETALDTLLTFAKGISENLPELVPTVIEIMDTIINTLIDHFPEIMETGSDLVIELCKGMLKALPKATIETAKIPFKIRQVISDGFGEIVTSAPQWGRDLLNGFANGIMERLGALKDTVLNATNTIRSYLHFSRPDVGPLRDYESWMPDMIQGMANSLDKAMPMLTKKMHDLAFDMSPTLNGNVNNSLSPSFNLVVNNNIEQDPLGQMVNTIKTYGNGSKNDYNYGYGG